jgi:cytochrome c
MNGMELNKLAASILLAGLVASVAGNLSDILYKPNLNPDKRGFEIQISTQAETTQPSASTAEPVTFDVKTLMANADAAKGQDLAKRCSACHSFDKNGPNKVGPHLWGVLEREKASVAGYSYSQAFHELKGKWDYPDLFHYLYDPKAAVPGNKMSFMGLKKPEDIANVVAYLRTLSDNVTPLP